MHEVAIEDMNTDATAPSVTKTIKRPACKFYGTKIGCRAAAGCQYRHVPLLMEPLRLSVPDLTVPRVSIALRDDTLPTMGRDQASQVKQIVRRFQAREGSTFNGMELHFEMIPTDPDFPFDIAALQCTLHLWPSFPATPPSLRVRNANMARGFQINIEIGFDAIWTGLAAPTLLNAMKLLDNGLENLLTAKKAETVTLASNLPHKTSASLLPTAVVDSGSRDVYLSNAQLSKTVPQITESTRAQRIAEVRLLKIRLGNEIGFLAEADDTIFTIPLRPRRKLDLPLDLQTLKSVRLFVPIEYNLTHASIQLLGVSESAALNVERRFHAWASKSKATLLAQINYISSNLHNLAKGQDDKETIVLRTTSGDNASSIDSEPSVKTAYEPGKSLPLPPEWNIRPRADNEFESSGGSDENDDSSSASETFTIDEANEASSKAEIKTSDSTRVSPRETGILMSFPDLELHGIELLEISCLGIVVKCDRCKETLEIPRIAGDTQSASCRKCACSFSAGFRKDILHPHSTRAGFLDLEGCSVIDLLPTTFRPTCSECSTTAEGVIAVRGQSTTSICRSCHHKGVFLIPNIKFLRINPGASLPLKQATRTKKDILGIAAGTELPMRGRCKHYSKSFRWFRFSCCNRVYACDKCHDSEQNHPNEFANRMICGFCSREQNYRPGDCGMTGCRRGLTGRVGTGFWEGGKGTRDKKRMSRKDPRKYKRQGTAKQRP